MPTNCGSLTYGSQRESVVIEKDCISPKSDRSILRKRWRCVIVLLFLAGLSATLLWFALANTAPRVHQPTLYPNALGNLVAKWKLPSDSVALLSPWRRDFSKDIIPLSCHSHNDYWRTVPLFEALAAGCTSVEADIHLPNDIGEHALLVGHKSRSLSDDRTLQSLYLKPIYIALQSLNNNTGYISPPTITRNWNGIFQSSPGTTLTLLPDFKSNGKALWPSVNNELQELRAKNWLTHWNSAVGMIMGPVTIVASGNAPFDLVTSNTTHRDIFFDAPLDDISNPIYNNTNSYYASVSMSRSLGRIWFWKFSSPQLQQMRSQVAAAKSKGLLSRYWGTPSWPATFADYVSSIVVENEVGVLNVDGFYPSLYFLLQTHILGNRLTW